jgi:hypothetical protein
MKRLIVFAFLMAGCVTQPIEPPRNMDEAYMQAQAIYISALSSMVSFKNDCGSRPPEIREDCWPVVERLRAIARNGIEHRQVLDAAYKAGSQEDFDSSVAGLRMMRTAIILEVSKHTKEFQE